MKLVKKISLLATAMLAISDLSYAAEPNTDYELKQVVIVSRHGLRAPLTEGADSLINATPYKWQKWDSTGGFLTAKGGALEVYMGHYFNDWLVQNGMLQKNTCPTDEQYYAYSNIVPRTIATGQFFTTGAFPGCDKIKYHHLADLDGKDPIFFQSINDTSKEYVTKVVAEIEDFIDQQNLASSYAKLQEVIDYKNSYDCKVDKKCELAKQPNTVVLEHGKESSIDGPLHLAFWMVDAFMLQDYEGFPAGQVAWGRIKSDQDWVTLAKLRNAYIDAAYLQPTLVNRTIKPMLAHLNQIMPDQQSTEQAKITLLVGHDTTVGPIIRAMGFNDYTLPEQYEKTPIGGKIVFQRWHNKKSDQDLLKVEYVYQSTKQLRNLEKLTLASPPQRVTLSLKDCQIDANGFCAWSDFKKVMNNLVN
ncbi:bifunctional glucose-1-phosphatase/inositol phosphatase [Orbus sturtevantii]|uniref:bifunctional glucose-1-phosphatase/inositol phosphatase n=1 Tax=Orbus sturtevantii TaxID=3074109 RepID=UPI00370D9959